MGLDDFPIDLKKMIYLMSNRGPDDTGFYKNSLMGLGHCRLSIIDLTDAGHQPMPNEDKSIWISYNGEIYNFKSLRKELLHLGHKFSSRSDTEVLIHGYEEWGTSLPGKLRGMFAFAIWDEKKEKLFLARDHFGIKPLYYFYNGKIFIFASEIKSILACEGIAKNIDHIALDQYLSFLYVPEPRTIFDNIKALCPGHFITITRSGITSEKYWEFTPEPLCLPKNELIEMVQTGIEDSVKSMLVADVPVGLFLSGGLDSSAILAMSSKYKKEPVQTFSVGFDSEAKHWDELKEARKIAASFNADHREFHIAPDVVSLVPQIVKGFDQPFANPTAIILYLLSKETSKYVKVVLAGTGGDEMFAGYPRYQGMLFFRFYQHLPVNLRQFAFCVSDGLIKDATDGRMWAQRIRRFFEGGTKSFDNCYLDFITVLNNKSKKALYSPDLKKSLKDHDTMDFIRSYISENSHPESLMTVDINTYLPFNQLAYGDRMSMAHSLEIRVPFVDQKLVKVAGAISLRRKLSGGRVTKGLFREAMKDYLPKDVIRASKKGLNLPIALWFKNELKGWVSDTLSKKNIRKHGYFNPSAIQNIIDEHLSGKRDNSLILWALMVFEIWHEIYME